MHLVDPQRFGIIIVFDFSWDDCKTREKLETMVYVKMVNPQGSYTQLLTVVQVKSAKVGKSQ